MRHPKMPQTVSDKAFCNELLGSFVLQHHSWLGKLQGRYTFAGFLSQRIQVLYFSLTLLCYKEYGILSLSPKYPLQRTAISNSITPPAEAQGQAAAGLGRFICWRCIMSRSCPAHVPAPNTHSWDLSTQNWEEDATVMMQSGGGQEDMQKTNTTSRLRERRGERRQLGKGSCWRAWQRPELPQQWAKALLQHLPPPRLIHSTPVQGRLIRQALSLARAHKHAGNAVIPSSWPAKRQRVTAGDQRKVMLWLNKLPVWGNSLISNLSVYV